ncbi:hypothetical protein BTM_5926 (plasmid) [Burkholderia thailandensis 34]|uniref:hypothetical protein n=1 Tax=Burkholderia thailandensis TaxID=57975 RepID=UPI000705BF6D|nr:hypothetical protein [Burkholderia thailandensis]AJY27080.1 hypothetical protein BTM_5926 [Burkholderia thailandensis 34]
MIQPLVVVLALFISAVPAEVLASPNPVDRLSDVAQFGMRPDGDFVLCDGLECPQRTLKHPAASAAPRSVSMPLPAYTESPARARSPAKRVRRHRQTSHRKPVVTCTPAARSTP